MKKAAVIYWSKTGNTEKMAKNVAFGLKSGGVEADLLRVSEVNLSKIDGYDGLIFGCPAMGKEVLEEREFEPFFRSVEARLKGRSVALFGAYGWGNGQWMRDWQERTTANGANLFEQGLTFQAENPLAAKIKRLFNKDKKLDEPLCIAFGKRFADFLNK
jgi:flavodoxin short chain